MQKPHIRRVQAMLGQLRAGRAAPFANRKAMARTQGRIGANKAALNDAGNRRRFGKNRLVMAHNACLECATIEPLQASDLSRAGAWHRLLTDRHCVTVRRIDQPAAVQQDQPVIPGHVEHIGRPEHAAGIVAAQTKGRERFARMVSALGGPADLMERPDKYLAQAPLVREVPALAAGFVEKIDTRQVGLAVVDLGGGRTDPAAAIDPAVGFAALAEIGAEVGTGAPIAIVHARDEASAARASLRLQNAYRIGPTRTASGAVVRETLGA